MKIIVFDTETTCLDNKFAEIWQFSGYCIDLANPQLNHRFNYNFKTKQPISYAARVRCNMTPEKIATFPEFDKNIILEELCVNEDNVYYVGHNLSFDMNIIAGVLSRENVSLLELNNLFDRDKWIDTLRLAKHIYDGVEVNDVSGKSQISFALGYLFHYLHLYNEEDNLDFHDARFDVDVTLRLLKHCCKELGFTLPQDIQKVANKSNSPIMIKRFNFGKYKGEMLSDVWKKDKGYFKWLIEKSGMLDASSPDYNEDLMLSIERLANG